MEASHLLETFLIDGKPLVDCTPAEALAWAAREKRKVLDVMAWVVSVERHEAGKETGNLESNAQQPMRA